MRTHFKRVEPVWIAALFCGLLFMFLLFFRFGFFHKDTSFVLLGNKLISEKESWMNILQQDKKIGYSHHRLIPKENGFSLFESTCMRLNTMGMVQDVYIHTNGELNSDFSLASFLFNLRSGMFNFRASGKVEGNKLIIKADEQEFEFLLENNLYLTAGILDAAWASGLEKNQARTFFVFDPASMGLRPVRITLHGSESMEVMGYKQNTDKVTVDFMGSSMTAWIGEDGSVVAEEGFMGIKLVRVSKDEALKGLDLPIDQDVTDFFSVASDVPIKQRDKINSLKIRIAGINDSLSLNGGRQSLADGILTINKENIPEIVAMSGDSKKIYFRPTPFVQSDHPEIKSKVSEIVLPDDTPLAKAQKIMRWIYENIQKRPVLSVPNALETLRNRMGDCNEHAVLMAAMARAAGVPAQIETGLVYMKGRFYYHAWNVLYLGDWVTVDALMGQMPADVTHIRLIRGEPDKQIDLIKVIGKVKIKILEQS
ncbi:MAG: transglutaminase-like domain-containing protein [Proteobacteria bacterium]|nr:transglutaminase domain-containing protein [Desulfobacteraceae bacterium]MBU4013954.1 transglutaminase-like domain-containing protein [Pseudomonadota bacterium]MBU4066804.1 transglutaminase-like domain-containing protein [Pseudomonadota bacterium]MBU4100531.1 transglutaminase-like domain-containing protein [Pseudomonadota bacterium]MBU4126917.1 transglutaminase-like domain-containing protein [Pseudomonadota bacterium]